MKAKRQDAKLLIGNFIHNAADEEYPQLSGRPEGIRSSAWFSTR
jgi:hypothetical protein